MKFTNLLMVLALISVMFMSGCGDKSENTSQTTQTQTELTQEDKARYTAEAEKAAKELAEWKAANKQERDNKRNAEIEQNRQNAIENQNKLNSQTQYNTSQQNDNIEYVEANINVLIDDVKNNAARANKAYSGKYVKIVGGIVKNIESNGDYINVDNGDIYSMLLNVQCYPKNKEVKEQILNLNKGQRITVYGKITDVGEIMGYGLDLDKIE